MMNRRIISVGVLMLLVGSGVPAFMTPVAADDHTILFVCSEGQPPCHADEIMDAIGMAVHGQVIEVRPGTYTGPIHIHGDAGQKDITIRSSEGPAATIIDPEGAFAAVTVAADRGNVTFEGFTILGNWTAIGIGQGLAAAEGTVFDVRDNIIEAPKNTTQHGNSIQVTGHGSTVIGNTVAVTNLLHPDWSASGILSYGANDVLIRDNVVTGDSPDTCISIGGGRFSTPISTDVDVINNTASGCNRGVLVQAGVVNATIQDNVIFNNTHGASSQAVETWQPAGTTISGNAFSENAIQVIDEYDTARDLDLEATLGANTFDFSVVSRVSGEIVPAAIFSKIQDTVDGSGAGHAITAMSAGDAFVEDVRIPAGLNDLGLQGGVTIEGGIRTAAINTTLSGFEIVGGGAWGDAGNDAPAVWLEGGTGGHALDGLSLIGDGNTSTGRGLLFGIGVTGTSVADVATTGWASGVFINPSSDLSFTGLEASENYAGIGSDGISEVTILDSVFTDNVEGIGASSVGTGVVVEGSVFEGNSDYGVANYGGETITATGNYWGAITGPEDIFVDVSISIGGTGINPNEDIDILDGAGDRVLGDVSYIPWCLDSGCNLNSLNIE